MANSINGEISVNEELNEQRKKKKRSHNTIETDLSMTPKKKKKSSVHLDKREKDKQSVILGKKDDKR